MMEVSSVETNRAIPGIGYKMNADLRELGLERAEDLRQLPKADLVTHFGERTASFLYLAARGKVLCAGSISPDLLELVPMLATERQGCGADDRPKCGSLPQSVSWTGGVWHS